MGTYARVPKLVHSCDLQLPSRPALLKLFSSSKREVKQLLAASNQVIEKQSPFYVRFKWHVSTLSLQLTLVQLIHYRLLSVGYVISFHLPSPAAMIDSCANNRTDRWLRTHVDEWLR